MEPSDIVNLVIPYLDYLSAPVFIFAVLAVADLITAFGVDLMKKIKSGYRL